MCIRDSDNPISKHLTDLTSNIYFNISFFTNTKSIILFTSIPSLPTPTLVYLWILLCLKKVLHTYLSPHRNQSPSYHSHFLPTPPNHLLYHPFFDHIYICLLYTSDAADERS